MARPWLRTEYGGVAAKGAAADFLPHVIVLDIALQSSMAIKRQSKFGTTGNCKPCAQIPSRRVKQRRLESGDAKCIISFSIADCTALRIATMSGDHPQRVVGRGSSLAPP